MHVREVDAGLLEHFAALEHPGSSAPAPGPLPVIEPEARLGLEALEDRAHPLLQGQQKAPHSLKSFLAPARAHAPAALSTAPLRASRISVGGPTRLRCGRARRSRTPRLIGRESASRFRGGGLPLRLALVETTGPRNTEQIARASGWAVTRSASVLRPPVSQSGTLVAAGTIQVTGPGQVSSSAAIAGGGSGAIRERICPNALAIRMKPMLSGRRFSASRRRTASRRKGIAPEAQDSLAGVDDDAPRLEHAGGSPRVPCVHRFTVRSAIEAGSAAASRRPIPHREGDPPRDPKLAARHGASRYA